MFNKTGKHDLARKEAELATLRQILRSLDTQMIKFTVDPDYKIIECNARFAALLGYPIEQLTGKMIGTLGSVRKASQLAHAALKTGSECSFTTSKLRFLACFRLAWPSLEYFPYRT